MPFELTTPESRFAVDAVGQAARLVAHIQSEMIDPALVKPDRSPVTVADFAAQALVARLLSEAFPADALVGEEDSAALREPEAAATCARVAGFVGEVVPDATVENVCAWIDRGNADPAARFWTLDPIDGTKGFLRGEQYAVALALIENGQVQLGALGCPNLRDGYVPDIGGPGSVVVAVRGHGAWTRPIDGDGEFKPLNASGVSDPKEARLLRSVESGHTNTGWIGRVVEALGVATDPVLMDSQAKYAVLAAGSGDALLRLLSDKRPDYKECIWDQAAGSIIVEESGGRITDLEGRALDFAQGRTLANNSGVAASNGLLHEALLAAVAKTRTR